MARKIDPTKIEKIREAAIEMIVEYGYMGASIASIAKRAGVSTGYMYRHYNSKEELIQELISNNFRKYDHELKEILNMQGSIYHMIEIFIRKIFTISRSEPIRAKFAATLALESGTRFENIVKYNEKTLQPIFKHVLEKGKEENDFFKEISERELAIIMLSLPLIYINRSLGDSIKSENLTKSVEDIIVRMCLNALK